MLLTIERRAVYAYTGTRKLDPAQPSIVFVHGAANDHSVWALQSRYFAYHGRNAVAVDLPGHGRSQGPALTGIEDMAHWVMTVLDAAGIERATLIGHSMGSLIGLEAAARCPERIDKLVLIGSAFPMKVSAGLLQSAHARDHAALEMINVWSHSADGQRGNHRVPGQWIMGSSLRLLERICAPLYVDFNACNQYGAGLQRAAEVRCPVLLISGTHDMMTPAKAARDLASKFSQSRTTLIDGCGHDLMSEQPDAVLDALRVFV